MDKCRSCDCELHEFSVSKKDICRHCYAEYCRRRYSRPDYQVHHRARVTANLLVKAGIIIQEPCKLCGDPNSEKHHPDYNNPTDVTFLCKKCHSELHVLERKVYAMAI